MVWSEEIKIDKGEKISHILLFLLIGAIATLCAVNKVPYLSGVDRMLFINRFILCLVIYGVFIVYYSWTNLKPPGWRLRDYGDYVYSEIIDLPESWSLNMRRYKKKVKKIKK